MNRETCFWSRARTCAIVVLFAATLACSLSQSTSSNLLLLKPLNNFVSSEATSVSQDGRFVVGNSFNDLDDPGPIRATLWEIQDTTQQPQPIDIPTPPELNIKNTVAVDISASGNVVVGYFQRSDGAVGAFYWSRSEGFVVLEIGAVALAVSADGRTVVGRTGVRDFGRLPDVALERGGDAVRWKVSESGVEREILPSFPGGDTAVAAAVPDAVSDDGTVAAGAATVQLRPNQFEFRAVRWTSIGIEDIGTLNGYSQGGVFDCSARGQECVGISFNLTDFEAFYWQLSSGIEPLDQGRRKPTLARRVSGDGLRVVGQLRNTAYLWQKRQPNQPAFENIDLNNLIRGRRPPVQLPLVQLEIAFGISPNAPYVVGRAVPFILPFTRQRIAFWLDTGFPLIGDVNRDGCVDEEDLSQILLEQGEGYKNADLDWNGRVDAEDILIWISEFGRGC